MTGARQIDAYAIGIASGAASAAELATAGAQLVLSENTDVERLPELARLAEMVPQPGASGVLPLAARRLSSSAARPATQA
jgi:hypothetical protein